jgi:hypothetical protein
MIRKLRYILFGFLVIIIPEIHAQNSNVMYYMNLPQNHLLNPALRPSNSFYLGLPAITGIDVNLNNNFIGFSDVFMKGQTSDSIITFLHPDNKIDDFIKNLKKINYLAPDVNIQLFGLGFSAGKDMYIFFDIVDRVESKVSFPGDLIKLGLLGNEQFLGDKIDLTGFGADAKYYREYGLGFSKKFTNKLRIGAKAKLLNGIAAVSMNNKALSITVGDDYSHTINADVSVNISGPVNVTLNPDNSIKDITTNDIKDKDVPGFLLNSSNMGLGLDIGAVYDITNELKVSGSLIDFGYMRWKSNVTSLNAKSEFKFSGFNVGDVVNGTKTFDELAQEMVDSLKNSFKISKENSAFTTFLPTGINLGASYNLTKNISVGILSHSLITKRQLRESVTLSANANIGNLFSTSFSYTAANHSYDNIGIGLAFRLGILQFYTIADKIPIKYNRIITDNSPDILLPDSWNTLNFRIGMNLAFGNRIKKKDDKPMMIEPQIIQ